MLAVGLLFSVGGGIAAADSDSGDGAGSGSAVASQGAAGNNQGTGASSGTARNNQANSGRRGTLNDAKPTTRITTRLSTTRLSTTQKSAADQTTTPAGTDDVQEGVGADGVEPLPTDTEPASAEQVTETAPGTQAPVPTVGANAAADDSSSVSAATPLASDASVAPTATAPPAPPVDPAAPLSRPVRPVTNVVNTFTDVLNSLPGTLSALQTSKTPITDAIASAHEMLTTVAGAITRVPTDFVAMLGIPSSNLPNGPLIGNSGALNPVRVHTPADAPLFGPRPGQVPQAVVPAEGASLFGTMAPRPALGKAAATGLIEPLSVSGTVPLTTGTPSSAQSIFEHVIEAVLVPASLTALAAVALPGVGALLVIAAAGVRVGYRQAKAGLALRASGIARFAGPSPLGVVRSGSLVTLRQRARGPRTKRAVCPDVSRSAKALEPAA